MRLQPAELLIFTRRGVPLAFDVVSADDPRPQPIVGQATLVQWDRYRGVVKYVVKIQQGDSLYVGDIYIRHYAT